MSFWQNLFKKTVQPTSFFSFLNGRAAPEFKTGEYYTAYIGWAYACINAISEEVATIKLHLYKRTKDGQAEISDHLALTLLSDVNPHMTSSDLFFMTAAYSKLVGEVFWYLPPGKVTKKPAEIWLLDPARVTIARSESTIIAGYVYHNEKGQDIPLAPEEVIHFKKFNPLNPWRGMGAVKAAALAIDTDTYSAKWNRNWFYNAAVPSGVVEVPGELTTEQYNRLKAQWNAQYGGVDNAHKVAVLEGGTKFNTLGFSQRDMDFIEQRRFSRDEILGIFRVPKTALGITEDVNRANAEATDYVFAKRVVRPEMQFIADRLTEFYLPLFGLKASEYFFGFDDPVPQNAIESREDRKAGLSSGYLTINEVRAELGKPPIDQGDSPYLPANLFPLGEVRQENQEKSTTLINKSNKKSVEKRIKFINQEINSQKKVIEDLLFEQKATLIRQIKTKKDIQTKTNLDELLPKLFSDWDDWEKKLSPLLQSILARSLSYAGKETLNQLGLDITFDLSNPRAKQWLEENALRHATQILATFKEEITTLLTTGVESGTSISDIASTIANFYDSQTSWRALRIARTEVIDGYAQGSLEGYHQSGLVKMKQWLTAGDDKVSESCAINASDGAIPLDATFSSGEIAPPSHPNCRCTLQPVI